MSSKGFSSGLVTLSLSIILPCLALSSALELALKNAAPTRPDDWLDLTESLTKRAALAVIWWPQQMFPNEAGILNASAALAFLATLFLSVLAFYASRRGPPGTTKVRIAVLLVLALNFVLALAAFLFSFIQSRVSARIDEDYVREELGGFTIYAKDTFTTEIWSCGAAELIGDDNNSEMQKACDMHMGARWLTFTTFIFSAALFAVIFLDSRREGHVLYSGKYAHGV